jgi:hypothetical protein
MRRFAWGLVALGLVIAVVTPILLTVWANKRTPLNDCRSSKSRRSTGPAITGRLRTRKRS